MNEQHCCEFVMTIARGCETDLQELLRGHGVALEVVDERVAGKPLDFRFRGRLTKVQEAAARAFLAHDIGVFVAPPGVGKTVVGTYLVASRACSTLILVHRRPLLDHWLAQLALFLGLDRKDIGQIGGAKRTPTERVDVAMIQSPVRAIHRRGTRRRAARHAVPGAAHIVEGYPRAIRGAASPTPSR